MMENGQEGPVGSPSGSPAGKTAINEMKRWVPVGLLAVIMAIGFAEGWYEQLSLSTLIRERQNLTAFVDAYFPLALAAYIVIYIAVVALSFPGASFLTVAGGFLFGWLLAGLATVLAATLGATVVFLAARSSFGAAMKARAGPFLSRLSSGFRENAMSYLLFLRLTPVFPFWLVNIAPAIFHVSVGTYVFSTFVGIIPGTFAFAFIGSCLDGVIAAQEAADPGCADAGSCKVDIGAFVTPELLAALFVLGFVSLIPVVLKKLRKKRAPK